MSIISEMKTQADRGLIPGACAHCKKAVYESLALLDDAYNVWLGKCPHCGALNYLSMSSLRGYGSSGMNLVLPTDEERDANNLPKDCPTSGACGRPADQHGTQAGEWYHKLGAKL